ncbi:MAG: cysteine desulfurase [Chloroflexi bacterium]|nr:cysteine desulfurase [Chloroflexota bacterium]
MFGRQIYMDHGATTPLHPAVLEEMLPYWTQDYGNPASSHHFGRMAERGLEKARLEIAQLLGTRPQSVIFTGCGSESDNLAIRGVMAAARAKGRGNHLITSTIEHKAILGTAKQLCEYDDYELTVLPVDECGQVRPADVAAAIRPNTALISIMAANNEIGSFQPFLEIGAIARDHEVLFHTDAVQAAAYTAWNLREMPIDLLSIAPHKFYGPKGIGILYLREGVDLLSSQTGGGQEFGIRAGTVNVPLAVGAAAALRLALQERESRTATYRQLSQRLITGVLSQLPAEDVILTGHPTDRLPHHVSFAFRGLRGNELIMHLDLAGISASSGSACTSGDPKPSDTLIALGLAEEWQKGGMRFTVGNQNTPDDIDYVVSKLLEAVHKLRQLSLQYA